MTSVNPSHNIFRQAQGRHAQAVYHADADEPTGPSASGGSKIPTGFPDLNEIDDEHDAEHSHGGDRAWARREARKRMRAAMPPLPDLRFEQSYLLSIRPFLHPRPSQRPAPTEKSGQEGDAAEAAADAAIVSSAQNDAVFHWGREVDVDWVNVAWVTVRDQFLSPFYFGIGWTVLGVALGVSTTFLRASLFPARPYQTSNIASSSGRPDASGTTLSDTAAAWWRRFVGLITPIPGSVHPGPA